MLAPLLLAASLALTADEPRWTPIVSYDEVRIEMDTARVIGRGPYSAWLRWRYLDRAASPTAWDAGVRTSLDLIEVDCARAVARTLSSTAYGGDGAVNAAMSLDEPAAPWRASKAGTIVAGVLVAVCDAATRRS